MLKYECEGEIGKKEGKEDKQSTTTYESTTLFAN